MATAAAEHGARQGGLSHIKVGMVCFLTTEVAFFSTLIVAYLRYLGHHDPGDTLTPARMLELRMGILGSICLLTSSATFFLAEKGLRGGLRSGFMLWLAATFALGAGFLVVTAIEWKGLIDQGLTIRTNLFGSTYYTLLGFHGFHVTLGLLVMLLLLSLAAAGHVRTEHALGVEMVGWYWHFVDAVWVVIFTIVYVIGR